MIHLSSGRRRPGVVDAALQAGLVAAAWYLVVRLRDGPVLVERALDVLTFAGGTAASILLLVAAWMIGNRPARRVAVAVAGYTGVALLLRAVAADPGSGVATLLADVCLLGIAGLLVRVVRGPSGADGDRPVRTVAIGLLATAAAVVATVAIVAPGPVPPLALSVAHLAAGTGVGAGGLLLVLVGLRRGKPLLCRTGLAFATIGAANVIRVVDRPAIALGGALELAAVAMLLVAALPFLLTAVRRVWRQEETAHRRLAEAEAVLASVADRDHELRNLVAGLSGAASVLAGDVITTADGRVLLEASVAELDRLRRMLQPGRAGSGPAEVAVGPVVRDLATVHRACGMDVRVDVEGDPMVAMDASALAQVAANLLVNCARHAPGAAVAVRVRSRGGEVRIEVTDDGPGLPPGWSDAVLRPGVRGPCSTGEGRGLAIVGDLARLHGGSFTLRSGGRGCRAAVVLPAAGRTLAPQRLGA